MVYNSDRVVERGKRIRAIIYYRDLYNYHNLYFLLFNRKSELHPGWEFLKGGVNDKDKSIEDAVYREMAEEAGIKKRHLIDEPILVDVNDAMNMGDKIETVSTYKIEVENNPPPSIILSEEHSDYGYFNLKDTFENLIRRPSNRLRDMFVFPIVLFKDFPEQYLQAKKLGYL